MVVKPARVYLQEMLDLVHDIDQFTELGQAEFMAKRKTQFAVIRAYELLGEIAKRLPNELLNLRPEIAWGALKGFRDVLIHQYDSIDLSIVWGAVERLSELRIAIEALIASLDIADGAPQDPRETH